MEYYGRGSSSSVSSTESHQRIHAFNRIYLSQGAWRLQHCDCMHCDAVAKGSGWEQNQTGESRRSISTCEMSEKAIAPQLNVTSLWHDDQCCTAYSISWNKEWASFASGKKIKKWLFSIFCPVGAVVKVPVGHRAQGWLCCSSERERGNLTM